MRDGPRGFGQDSSCPGLLRCRLCPSTRFAYGAVTRCGPSFQRVRLRFFGPFVGGPTTPVGAETPPVWAPARSLATTCAIIRLFSFPPGTEMFQFPGFAPSFKDGGAVARAGLPHSDIRGSMDICSSPRLFAACHVLRRLREPRHPSCALVSFLYDLFSNRYLFVEHRAVFSCLCRQPRTSFLLFDLLLVCFDSLRITFFFRDARFQHVNVLCSLWVENNGFEPLTPCLQSRCSSQLS